MIETNGQYEHRHRVQLNIDGRRRSGWLSPDLALGCTGDRSLILLTLAPDDVPQPYRDAFRQFEGQVSALDPRRISSAKRAVQKIITQEWRDPRYRVALHRMGPVPAFALEGTDLRPAALGGSSATVVVFPRVTEYREALFDTPRGNVNADLFYCLSVSNVSAILHAYFEDVFEHLKDMSDHLGLLHCLNRIRSIREVLTQSVIAKLSVLTPSQDSWKSYLANKLPGDSFEYCVCQWFEAHATEVGEAIFLSCLADRCIWEFLELLGLRMEERSRTIRTVDYRLDGWKSLFCGQYGLPANMFNDSHILNALELVFSVYRTGDLDALRSVDTSDRLARNVRDFLYFLTVSRRELRRIFREQRYVSRDAIVFLSRRFSSPFGNAARDAIEAATERASHGAPRITTFEGDGGEPLRASLKAQIWLADAIWSLVPEHDLDVGQNLKWIYLEAEHGVILNKPSLAIARSGEDLSRAIETFRHIGEPMLAESLTNTRALHLASTLEKFREGVAIVDSDPAAIETKAAIPLDRLRLISAQVRRRTLLTGYLRMFEPSDIEVFRGIFDWFRQYRFTKNDYVAKCTGGARPTASAIGRRRSPALSRFENAYERAKDRAVLAGATRHQVITYVERGRQYLLGLYSIARLLADDRIAPASQIEEDIRAALDDALV